MEKNRSHGKGPHLSEPAAQRGGRPQRKQRKGNSRTSAPKSGILSQETVIPEANMIGERSQANYDCLLASYVEHFKPEGPAERHQLEVAVGALWRYRRLLCAKVGEILNHEKELGHSCKSDPNRSPTATGKHRTSVPESQESESLQRREDHLLRVYNRALSELARLQRPRLGDNRKTPIAIFVRVERRSGGSSNPQGARPRNPKWAASPEDSPDKDKGFEQQMTSRSQRSPDQAARDGTQPPGVEEQQRELDLGPNKGKRRRERLEASREDKFASGRSP